MGKTLVAYFSASGVTAKAAEKIAEAIGADLYESRPQLPYTAKDLDWMNRNRRSSVEMNDPASRPAIAQSLDNMAQYDTILVGFPIWWYVEPRIIDTFLESYDFSGKTMIPFATSGSSGIEKAQQSLQAHCPKAVWEKGQLLNRTDPAKWAKGL